MLAGVMIVRSVAVLAALLVPLSEAVGAEEAALPNPITTPGAVDPRATREVVCNGRTRDRRHVTAAMKAAALDAYNIPRSEATFYEIDHHERGARPRRLSGAPEGRRRAAVGWRLAAGGWRLDFQRAVVRP